MTKRKNGFNLIAGVYDALAFLVFGNLLKQAQSAYLRVIPDDAKVLILGGGTGWILEALLKERPNVNVKYIEASSRMLALSMKRIPSGAAVVFVHGTEQDLGEGDYDCIITNFFLDVFTAKQLPDVMRVLERSLHAEGLWLCTDFRQTGRWRHRFLIWLMHRFFRVFASLNASRLLDFRAYFKKADLLLQEETNFRGGLIFSSVYRKKK